MLTIIHSVKLLSKWQPRFPCINFILIIFKQVLVQIGPTVFSNIFLFDLYSTYAYLE